MRETIHKDLFGHGIYHQPSYLLLAHSEVLKGIVVSDLIAVNKFHGHNTVGSEVPIDLRHVNAGVVAEIVRTSLCVLTFNNEIQLLEEVHLHLFMHPPEVETLKQIFGRMHNDLMYKHVSLELVPQCSVLNFDSHFLAIFSPCTVHLCEGGSCDRHGVELVVNLQRKLSKILLEHGIHFIHSDERGLVLERSHRFNPLRRQYVVERSKVLTHLDVQASILLT